jgi:hypothetical protein
MKNASFTAFKYSYAFSYEVVERYYSYHPRGIRILEQIYPNLKKDDVVRVFMAFQKRWNVFKKMVKLCERLSMNPEYDLEFIKQRCLTSVKYFRDMEEGKTWLQMRKAGKSA